MDVKKDGTLADHVRISESPDERSLIIEIDDGWEDELSQVLSVDVNDIDALSCRLGKIVDEYLNALKEDCRNDPTQDEPALCAHAHSENSQDL